MPRPSSYIVVDATNAASIASVLSYDSVSGIFRWRQNRGGTAREGSVAGSLDRDGYVLIRIGNSNYKAHRLAWLMAHGELPSIEFDVDHIDGNPSNNSTSNLRLATRSQNLRNSVRPVNNSSGLKGAYWVKSKGKWKAGIQHLGRAIHFGYFCTAEEAHAAYCRRARELSGKFARFA